MYILHFNGIEAEKLINNISVVGNNRADVIEFVLAALQESVSLTGFNCYLKVQNSSGSYLNKIALQCSQEGENITAVWRMTFADTQYKELQCQLQFQSDDEGEIVWQSRIFYLKLQNTIPADEYIDTHYPSELRDLEYRVSALEEGITVDTYSREIIDEKLDAKQNTLTFDNIPTEGSENPVTSGGLYTVEQNLRTEINDANNIIIDNPNHYLNENGLTKIIRQQNQDGSISDSYMINKSITESTLITCTPTYVGDGEELDEELIIDDLGENDFYGIFGENVTVDNCQYLTVLDYRRDEVIKGIRFGSSIQIGGLYMYGCFELSDCEPNKDVRIIVGKYFEYDEHGNKVFDENCKIYSTCFADGTQEYKEITEERQEFVLNTTEQGVLYFDSDNELQDSPCRFILYEINCGEEGGVEYKKVKLGEGGQPTQRSNKAITLSLEKGRQMEAYSYEEGDSYDFTLLHDLHINLINFTQEDVGKRIYLYRKSYTSNTGSQRKKSYVHPVDYRQQKTNAQYLGYAAFANTPYSSKHPERGNRPAAPDWMPHNGAMQTEWQITQIDIQRGYINIELSRELLCLFVAYINEEIYVEGTIDFDISHDAITHVIGITQRLTFALIEDNQPVLFSQQILKVSNRSVTDSYLRRVIVQCSTDNLFRIVRAYKLQLANTRQGLAVSIVEK